MMNNRMITKKVRILSIGMIFVTTSILSWGQSRQEKTETVIKRLNLVENQKINYEFQIEPLKYQATGNDSIKIIELEKILSDEEILKRLSLAFKELFSDKEIKDIYEFTLTSAFDKFFNSEQTYKAFAFQFNDIDKEIKAITQRLSKAVETPSQKFEPIPIDKADGLYATVNYTHLTDINNIKLEENPSVTPEDILEIKKEYSKYNDNRPEISILLTNDGARKFYLLTKENIGKPIAIVIDHRIVSIPRVQSEIIGGKVKISGDFSENEIDTMIKKLSEK